MAQRAIATLSLTFGLVSIPVKLYSATKTTAAIRFKLMGRGGVRLRQQYVPEDDVAADEPPPAPEPPPKPSRPLRRGASLARVEPEAVPPEEDEDLEERPATVERHDIVKAYEFEKGKYVLFTPDELKALREASRDTIDIVAFIPQASVDPIYYDKAYLLAPDKRGEKSYSLLLAAMRRSGRCALAKWAWRSKEYVVQIRPAEGGLVLQQLLYADEVRSLADLDIDVVKVGEPELALALRLIEQLAQDTYDPTQFVDEEKLRILAAVEQKIAGREVVAPQQREGPGGQVIDLMEALRASLAPPAAAAGKRTAATRKTARSRSA